MKFKKLLGITLLTIPLYFFTPNVAKAEEFKINLKNPEVKTEKTNLVNDFDTMIMNLDFDDFLKRVEDRIENRLYEKNFLLEVSPETNYFLFNWENATKHMNDVEKKIYMDKVDKELEKIFMKEFKKEAQQDFKESKFYEWLKEEQGYYKKWAKEMFGGNVKVKEKQFCITDTGGIDFSYKKKEFKNVSKEDRFKFRFKGSGISADLKDFFEFRIKARPFGFHKWDYNPRVDLYLTTKYGTIHSRTKYLLRDEKLDTSVSTSLPKGFVLSVDYTMDNKDKANIFSTTLSKTINEYNLSLSYTKTHYDDERLGTGTIYFLIQKTW